MELLKSAGQGEIIHGAFKACRPVKTTSPHSSIGLKEEETGDHVLLLQDLVQVYAHLHFQKLYPFQGYSTIHHTL